MSPRRERSAARRWPGIWDDDAGRGLAAAAEFSARSYERLDQLLADVDALIVTSENTRHHDLALAAAGARVHVLNAKSRSRRRAADARR
ncbi:MAG: Gfo/Idh/MocA family oxidoreductase [Kouleothrix sp.]|nr:Gfo/Idh/MocA family oxidoreductase [Kouleothrix sp.]